MVRFHLPTSERPLTESLALLALILGLTLACEDQKELTAPERPVAALAQTAAPEDGAQAAVTAAGTIPLPVNQSVTSAGVAFGITQLGTGPSGFFKISKATSTKIALLAQTNGTEVAFNALSTGTGRAGLFEQTSTTGSVNALEAVNRAGGAAVQGRTLANGTGGFFWASGVGLALQALAGPGNAVSAENTGSNATGLFVNNGTGAAGEFFAAKEGPTIVVHNNFAQNSSVGLAADAKGSGVQGIGGLVGIVGFGSVSGVQGHGQSVTGFAGRFSGPGNGVQIQSGAGKVGLAVSGGTKQAVVATPSGARSLYTEESSEVWFTDYGFSRLVDGRARLLIDPTFAQTINPEEPYHVFLEEYGDAQLYVAERTALGFVVQSRAGDPDVEFSYRLVARRRGYETTRLEPAPWADRTSAEVATR